MKKLATFLLMLSGAVWAADQPVDRNKSPSADARWVTLILRTQEGVTPEVMTLQYQSKSCKESRAYGVGGGSQSGSMQMLALDFEKINLVRQQEEHRYQARFAIDGGGPCQWLLQTLSVAFKYRSRNVLVKDQEATSWPIEIAFNKQKDARRSLNVRMQLDYFPVIVQSDSVAKNQLRLRPRQLFMLPSFDPAESGILLLQPKVFDELPLIASSDPQSRYQYLLRYPDGSSGKASSLDQVGVNDGKMNCLLQGKAKCDTSDLSEN